MLHDRAGFGALGVARLVVFGLWLLIVVTTPLHLVAEIPGSMHTPPGVLQLLPAAFWDGFLAPGPLNVFRWLLALLLLLAMGGGRAFQPLAILGTVGLILFDGTLKGYGGFTNHAQFALLYCAGVIALAPSGEGLRLRIRRGWFGAPRSAHKTARLRVVDPGSVLRLGALLVAIPYALIGVHRLAISGPFIFLDDSLPRYVLLRSIERTDAGLRLGYLATGSGPGIVVLKLGFCVATFAEIGSVWAIFNRSFRRAWLGVIVPFHVVTLFTMGIFFWENLALIGVFFTELPTRVERWLGRSSIQRRGWLYSGSGASSADPEGALATSNRPRGSPAVRGA